MNLNAYADIFVQVDGVDVNWTESFSGAHASGKLVLAVDVGILTLWF
jgi:hypothetical protein